VRDDDPQRTQEWDAPPDENTPGSTAAEAEAAAAAREAHAQAERTAAEARGAELRAEVAETDVRRAEEETAKAHDHVVEAEQQEEKISRKERKAKERAEKADAEAARAREQAAAAAKLEQDSAAPRRQPELSGAHVTSPGLGADTDPAVAASAASYRAPESGAAEAGPLDRPEVVAGLAFAGAFVFARVLKRIFD
jgi:hypothetical protein